jgi:hypothetical protein
MGFWDDAKGSAGSAYGRQNAGLFAVAAVLGPIVGGVVTAILLLTAGRAVGRWVDGASETTAAAADGVAAGTARWLADAAPWLGILAGVFVTLALAVLLRRRGGMPRRLRHWRWYL